jgi:hypothetical protein
MMTGALKLRQPAMSGTHNRAYEIAMWSAQDFDVAYRRGKWQRLLRRMLQRPNKLPAFGEVAATCRIAHQSDRGLRSVALHEIVGSVGRSEDFDNTFMPLRSHTKQRWISINRAYYLGVPLPPVELIQVNDRYMVVDGHHRISVARAHGQAYLDAHVVQVELRCGKAVMTAGGQGADLALAQSNGHGDKIDGKKDASLNAQVDEYETLHVYTGPRRQRL